MPSATPSAAEGQLRRARSELETGLRAGEDRRAEDLLAAYPAVAADPETALELVYTEFVVRGELGQNPSPAEWYTRFPHWRADLEQMFQLHDELCKADAVRRSRSAVAPTRPLARPDAGAPNVVDGYEVLGELGRGGMGVVYKARQPGLNRVVALKVILSGAHAGEKERERFRFEAEAAARLDHPGIVRVYEVGESDGRPYCAMEYVDGDTLSKHLGTPWAPKPAAELVAALARAAHHAHERGVVHRDLKPANVLLQRTADRGQRTEDRKDPPAVLSSVLCPLSSSIPKITDFGLAKCLHDSDPGPTRTGDMLGTPAYMAPEQAEGKAHSVGPATDIWALGVLFYELLTGHPPFQGDSGVETLNQIRTDEPVPPRRLRALLPRDLDTICLTCLTKSPAGRYPTAAALADDLDRWLRGEPIVARPVGPAGRAARWCRRNPRVAALWAAVAVLAGVAAGFGLAAVDNLADARAQADRLAAQERTGRMIAELARGESDKAAEQVKANATLVEAARQKEAGDRRERQRQVARLQVADGARRLEAGDYAGAAVLFAAALAADPDPNAAEAHRVRLGTTLREIPDLRQSFHVDTEFAKVELSGSGSTLLVRYRAAGDRPVVWDVESAAPRPALKNKFRLGAEAAALTFDGGVGVEVGPGGVTSAWDTVTGDPVSLPLTPDRGRLPPPFSPDGARRLRGPRRMGDPTAAIVAADGSPVGDPLDHGAGIDSYVLDPTGTVAATGGPQGVVRLWDAVAGRPLDRTLKHGYGAVVRLAFSPDGTRLASVSNDGTCQVWEVRTGAPTGARFSFAGLWPAVAFRGDGARLTVAGDLFARSWVPEPGGVVGYTIVHGQERPEIWYAPTGRAIGIHGADGSARVWDPRTGRPITPALGRAMAARHTADGRAVVVAGGDGSVRVWEPKPPVEVRHPEVVWTAGAWLPDGSAVVTATAAGAVVWDPATGDVRHTLAYPNGQGRPAVVGPDGRRVAAVGQDGVARLWDLRTGGRVGEDFRHRREVMAVAFTRDGRLASGSEDGEVRFWDAETGAAAGRPLAHPGPVRALSFTPDGRRMLVPGSASRLWDLPARKVLPLTEDPARGRYSLLSPTGEYVVGHAVDNRVRFFDPETGRRIRTTINPGTWVDMLTVSPDGRFVAADLRRDRQVQVWDARSGEAVGLPIPYRNAVQHLAFRPDGRLLAVATVDGTVQVWDPTRGEPVTPPLDSGGVISFAAFSPDGRRLLAGGTSQAARVYDLTATDRPAEELAAFARLLANRKLDDRGLFVPLPANEEQALWARFAPAAKPAPTGGK